MNDRTFYDEAFFAELDQPIPLRKQVVEWIDRYCATTGKSHSFAWRKAYLELEEVTGFRVPDKKGLDAVEKAGRMPQLLEVVKKLSEDCGDHAAEVNNAIPDYIPYESDRSRWKTNAQQAEVRKAASEELIKMAMIGSAFQKVFPKLSWLKITWEEDALVGPACHVNAAWKSNGCPREFWELRVWQEVADLTCSAVNVCIHADEDNWPNYWDDDFSVEPSWHRLTP